MIIYIPTSLVRKYSNSQYQFKIICAIYFSIGIMSGRDLRMFITNHRAEDAGNVKYIFLPAAGLYNYPSNQGCTSWTCAELGYLLRTSIDLK